MDNYTTADHERSSGVKDHPELISVIDTISILRKSLKKYLQVFDALGAHAPDDETIRILREALQKSCQVFDALAAHAPDDARLSVLRTSQFLSAAYESRAEILETRRSL